MNRIAIIIEKKLIPGLASNSATILMGQLALLCPEIYSKEKILDCDKQQHAAIKVNIVLLKATEKQIVSLNKKLYEKYPSLKYVLFSKMGQNLHNAFKEYQAEVQKRNTEDLHPIGIIMMGDDSIIREITKKFSLL